MPKNRLKIVGLVFKAGFVKHLMSFLENLGKILVAYFSVTALLIVKQTWDAPTCSPC
jgi:hypothetical protein